MTGKVDPCLRVHVLSASALPRSRGGSEPSSWFVEAKICTREGEILDEEPRRTQPSRVGVWNEELIVHLDDGDAQHQCLQLGIIDATSREEGFETSTFRLGDFVPWNCCSLDVHMGRDVGLRVSIVVMLEDPMVEIQHMLHLGALLLTFPSGMPLPGVKREAGAAVKSTIQCVVKGTANDPSLSTCMTEEPPLERCDAAGPDIITIGTRKADVGGGILHLWSTLPVPIVEDQVMWEESIDFPVGRQVKKAYMPHSRAYPRQLYGKGMASSVCQVAFIISFFVVESPSQAATALGFVVLDIPDDVRLFDDAAELSADVTSPGGEPLEGVVCVVDLKVTGPPPRSARDDELEEDESDDDETHAASMEGSQSHAASMEESQSRTTTSESRRELDKNSKDTPKMSSPATRREKALHDQAQSLREEAQAARTEAGHKQMIVDRLSEEVDKRSDAIRKCGAEIVKLRKHVEVIERERCRLDSQLKALRRSTAEAEMEANRVIKSMADGTSGGLDGGTSGRHTRALAKQCIVLTEENRTLRRVAEDSANERWQTAVLKSEMEKMKKTQHVQSVYIRKMQALPGRVSAYKSTVHMQEKVIAKLEMLTSGCRPPSNGSAELRCIASDAGDTAGGKKTPSTAREVRRLVEENAELRWRLAIEGNVKQNDAKEHSPEELRWQVETKDTKIRVLEEQMIINAKEFGEEIAGLTLRIMELEMGIAGSGGSPNTPLLQRQSRP